MATQSRIGCRPYVSQVVNAVDADATAFIAAAGITDLTQAAAISTLVNDLKTYGIWSKMKAIYPFVGGSATSHKFNLKDPRDLNAAYRLIFNGGWTHSSNGALPNGTTGYANTNIIPSVTHTSNNLSMGLYTNTNRTASNRIAYGCTSNTTTYIPLLQFYLKTSSNQLISDLGDFNYGRIITSNTDSSGFYVNNRPSSNSMKVFRNGNLLDSSSVNNITNTLPNSPLTIACFNGNSTYSGFETINYQFFYTSDGLTDTEATNFYTSIQKFQTTLGRQVGTPAVSDADAQAFLNAANITSFQQASAVNTLVTDLKSAGIWTKMKAIYPFVGGSANSHKFNLKDPRDLDAAYRLVFNGGWTHTNTGALPNGTTGYADTKLKPTDIEQNSAHMSTYLIKNYSNGVDMGCSTTKYFYISANLGASLPPRGPLNLSTYSDNSAALDTRAFYIASRTNSTTNKLFRNTTLISNETYASVTPEAYNIYIGAGNRNNAGWQYSQREQAFASIGDGLTDGEATSFYTAVQKFQTSLGRQVGTPVYNTNGLVLNLDAGNPNSYPGTGTTWFDLASGNNGTLVNGPTYDINNGGSLYFDGTNKYTDISYTKINITNKITINSWVYFLSQPSTTGNPNIVDKWDWPNNKRSFTLGTENGYLATAISYDGLFDNRIVCSDNSSIVLNQWINITMTYDGRTLKLYKNGSLIQSSSFTQDRNIFSDITTNIFLGRSRGTEGSSRHLNARISGVQIYSNSLSATEILNNFNSTRGRFGI